MDCVNHSGVNAEAYCQRCGKALCQACVRKGAGGQIFCEPCWMAWTATANAPRPYVPPPMGGPSPWLAAMLGWIPGVGAMYNGQFVKGLVHVAIFAVLVSASHVFGVFGLFIAAWIFYQVFDAYHTARARRDGDPLPDPLGLNEVGNWFATGVRPPQGPQPGAPGTSQYTGQDANQNAGQNAGPDANQGANQGAGQPSNQASYQPPYQAPYAGAPYQAPYQAPHQAPYQAPYQGPYAPPPPGAAGPGFPPMPPMPPVHWRRREPVGAILLIGLGVLFLLGQFDWFSWQVFEYFWPLLLIGLGVWMIVRRAHDAQGGPPNGSPGNWQGGQR